MEYYEIHCYRFQWLLNYITRLSLPKGSNVLDVGCYPQYLFKALKARRFKVHGISSEHESVAQKGVSILNIEDQPIPFASGHFDLVVLSEVIEHLVRNHIFVLSEISRTLSKNGYLLITTPNVNRFQNIIKLIFGQNIYFPLSQLSEVIYHRHNREFSLSELKYLVAKAGLKTVDSGWFVAYPPFRRRNQSDSFVLKFAKYIHYFIMLFFPWGRDTLYILASPK